MWGCTLNGILASSPSLVIILRKPTALMGAPVRVATAIIFHTPFGELARCTSLSNSGLIVTGSPLAVFHRDHAFRLEVMKAEDIIPSIEAAKGAADALYVCSDPFLTTQRVRINTLAASAKIG